MIQPAIGQHITIFIRGGAIVEGTIVEWSDKQSVIKSAPTNTLTVIPKTLDDILYYKLRDTGIASAIETVIAKPIKNTEDIKTLAELRAEAKILERETLREQITSHVPSVVAPRVQYGNPYNVPVKSTQQYTRKEIAEPNTDFAKGLQSMFKQKRNS